MGWSDESIHFQSRDPHTFLLLEAFASSGIEAAAGVSE
jgi:hypothetical protein